MIEQIKEQIKENAKDYVDNGETLDDAIYMAIDELIYDEDLWAIMQEYQRPQDANLQDALDLLFNDVYDEMRGCQK